MRNNWNKYNGKGDEPQVNESDAWDKEHKLSKRVLVWVIDHTDKDIGACFATYHHNYTWVIDVYSGASFRVISNGILKIV